MLVYQMGIQIYDQISILGIWLKVKLHDEVLLRFGLKEGKRALNISKFCMHSVIEIFTPLGESHFVWPSPVPLQTL